MIRAFLLSLTVALGFAPLQQPAPNAPAEAYRVPEAYEIYSQLLSEGSSASEGRPKKLIIRQETIAPDDMCVKPEGASIPILAPVIADFVEKNNKPWLLQEMFTMPRPYEFVSAADLDAIFEKGPGGWKGFYERYPKSGGYLQVSAIGFNAEKTIAIVYMAHGCGGLCGGGGFSILEKKDGKWREMKWQGTTCTWVS